jgi:methyl-accepting chemotaxis protein
MALWRRTTRRIIPGEIHAFRQDHTTMKLTYRSSLQRTMIIYFLLIGLASILVGAEFILDVHRLASQSASAQQSALSTGTDAPSDGPFQAIQKIKNKAILMVVILLAVVVILLTMFIKNITEPLQHIIEVSKLIAAGDLSQTINISGNNELTEMGSTVNDLTSNLQEIVLLSEDICMSMDRFTGTLSGALAAAGEGDGDARKLQDEIQLLSSKSRVLNNIIMNCKFYGIER